jgi:hypothetical protein
MLADIEVMEASNVVEECLPATADVGFFLSPVYTHPGADGKTKPAGICKLCL